MARKEEINPEVLVWARETAGLSLDEAAARIGLTTGSKSSATEKLTQFEQGEKSPTRNQLLKFATTYRRPLVSFYMKNPPPRGERGEDFRLVSGGAASPRDNALLDALIRDIRARQEMVRSVLEDEGDTVELDFVGSARLEDGVDSVSASIARRIGFDPEMRRSQNLDPEQLFRDLRERVEAVGVFVLLIGDLGSHHSAIGEEVFRGFVIADKLAPFIVINDNDARAARSFTLLHELTHIWMGQSGVSGSLVETSSGSFAARIERFCNDVAAEILLPTNMLLDLPAVPSDEGHAVASIVEQISNTWGVSEAMAAYRLFRLGRISAETYRALSAAFAIRWRTAKQRQKDEAKDNEGGPSYYVVRRFKLGNALVDVVRRTLRDNLITHTKAAKVLGVKPSSVERLVRGYEASQSRLSPESRG